LINNNQPQGKNSIKNIRFCSVANCSSSYSPCTSLWRIRARPKIKPAKMPVEFLVGCSGQKASCDFFIFYDMITIYDMKKNYNIWYKGCKNDIK